MRFITDSQVSYPRVIVFQIIKSLGHCYVRAFQCMFDFCKNYL